MKALKSIWALFGLCLSCLGGLIVLGISIVCPPLGIVMVGGFLYYIYKCCKKRR